ncbi:MAG: ABC transporter permease [Beijerinckiaceae bacterium]
MRFALIRLLRAVITIWAVVTIVFFVLRVTGDPVYALVPDDATPEVVALYRERWGLDQPLWAQYVNYWGAVFTGDLGRSFVDRRDALTVVMERLPKTLLLMGAALSVALLIGISAGTLAAIRRDTLVDRAVIAISVAGYSLPTFFLGLLAILLFAVELRWLPSSGSATAAHLVLPAFTIGLHQAAIIARFARSSMLEVLGESYIRTATAKGLARAQVVTRHAMPNAAIPLVTILGFSLGGLVGGALVVETVFAWPGIGRLLVTAVGARDLAVVQTCVILIAAAMVTATLLVDLSYAALNPKIRVGGR